MRRKTAVQFHNSRTGCEWNLCDCTDYVITAIEYVSTGSLQQCVPVCAKHISPWQSKQAFVEITWTIIGIGYEGTNSVVQCTRSKSGLVFLCQSQEATSAVGFAH